MGYIMGNNAKSGYQNREDRVAFSLVMAMFHYSSQISKLENKFNRRLAVLELFGCIFPIGFKYKEAPNMDLAELQTLSLRTVTFDELCKSAFLGKFRERSINKTMLKQRVEKYKNNSMGMFVGDYKFTDEHRDFVLHILSKLYQGKLNPLQHVYDQITSFISSGISDSVKGEDLESDSVLCEAFYEQFGSYKKNHEGRFNGKFLKNFVLSLGHDVREVLEVGGEASSNLYDIKVKGIPSEEVLDDPKLLEKQKKEFLNGRQNTILQKLESLNRIFDEVNLSAHSNSLDDKVQLICQTISEINELITSEGSPFYNGQKYFKHIMKPNLKKNALMFEEKMSGLLDEIQGAIEFTGGQKQDSSVDDSQNPKVGYHKLVEVKEKLTNCKIVGLELFKIDELLINIGDLNQEIFESFKYDKIDDLVKNFDDIISVIKGAHFLIDAEFLEYLEGKMNYFVNYYSTKMTEPLDSEEISHKYALTDGLMTIQAKIIKDLGESVFSIKECGIAIPSTSPKELRASTIPRFPDIGGRT